MGMQSPLQQPRFHEVNQISSHGHGSLWIDGKTVISERLAPGSDASDLPRASG